MKMRKKSILIFLFLKLFSFLSANDFIISENNLQERSFIWQGFHYKWERVLLNFLTPHRVGSIESRFSNETFSQNASSANLNIQFTPGLNGDYAFPSSNFSIVYSKQERAKNLAFLEENSTKNTKFYKSIISFNFTDEADHSKNPHAESKIDKFIKIPKFDYDSQQTILNGFKIDMKCVDISCNSNGVWPYKLNIDISECNEDSEEKSMLECHLLFELNRGWTPAKGGGKAFNFKMLYDIEVDLLTIYMADSNNIVDDIIKEQSTLHSNAIKLTRSIEMQSNGYDENGIPFTGITGLGFELLKYKNYNDLGRYIGNLQFQVGNTIINEIPQENKFKNKRNITYDAILNLNAAPKTTFPCNVELSMKTKSFIIKDKSIKRDLSAKGKVCRDDPSTLFFCKLRKMENSQKDFVIVQENLE